MTDDEYKRLTLREFDDAAAQFDNDDPSIYNMCRKDYPDILAEVRREPFSSLLDAGCGTGAMLSLMARDVPEASYTGIDLSSKMIEVARTNAPGVTFVQGDCEALPFGDASFDVITCSMSFHHYPTPVRFFRNARRVLRPGGRLILRDMTSRSALILWLTNHVELPLANRLLGKGDVHCYSRSDVQELCDAAGLTLERFEVRPGMRLHAVIRRRDS